MVKLSAIPVAALFALIAASTALGSGSGEAIVTGASPTTPFSQNKQNEPTIANDASHPKVLAAGSNDEIDEQGCDGSHCPFTAGVGVSGIYFSFDSGHSWIQPTYTGWSARACKGGPCTPKVGPIGTLPFYFENGLVSDGDPGVAFGPRAGANGFSWSNGSRLYYSNLTSNFSSAPTSEAFNGAEAIAVSRTDDVRAAAASNANAWMAPVIISRQSSTTFSDKSQIWADNASSSPFFGNVYVCWARFQGQEKGHAAPAQLQVAVSSDGGNTWSEHPIGAAANNGQRNPLDGCTVRTDSHGNAFVFGVGTVSSSGGNDFELMSVSSNGGGSWSAPAPVAGPVFQPGVFDPGLGRTTIDGIAGARSDLAIAPSVDLANGAPSGVGATNRIVMSFVSGSINTQHVFFTESTNGGATWATPRAVETAGDHGIYTAPAISPNGTDVYVVYNAFTNTYRTNTSDPRNLVGVLVHATITGPGATGAFSSINRGANGDPRGTSQNGLTAEFLGDYVYATATRTYGAAVWNDARFAADCSAVDTWRMSLRTAPGSVAKPAPLAVCAAAFGNSDIFSFTTAP
ncbi:MAG TPA: sialidase family protein [Candidatus Dormibacteraeota bacterium]|nr:sialidase family protein [Candidatus Dormibacteraeota bacterium]